MAKVKTIQEKREEMEKALARLEAYEKIIAKLDDMLKWDYCEVKHDENGELMKNDNGEWVFVEPEKDAYGYDRFIAMKSAIEEIKALV